MTICSTGRHQGKSSGSIAVPRVFSPGTELGPLIGKQEPELANKTNTSTIVLEHAAELGVEIKTKIIMFWKWFSLETN